MIELYLEPPTYIPSISNADLFLKAYKKWASTEKYCKCNDGVHGSILIEHPIPAECERHKSWQIYVKTRENISLNDEEKVYVGLM